MPFLRFSRDKRGYETTALLHAFRERGRSQPRLLYWFRGPVAAKVGRSAIDEDAIRLIEEHYREISFDWQKILRTGTVVEARKRDAAREPAADAMPPGEQAPEFRAAARGSENSSDETPPGGEHHTEERGRRRRSRRRGRTPAEQKVVSDAETPAARAAEAAEPAHTAAEEWFSPEDLTRLRGRYAALLARIDREVQQPAAAEGLRGASEALNPDTWVTREDVKLALEHYETRYRQLLDSLAPHK